MQKGSDNQDVWMRLLKLVPASWVAFTEQCNAIPCGTVGSSALWESKGGSPGISFQTWFNNLKSIRGTLFPLCSHLSLVCHGHLEGYCPETFESHFLTLGRFVNDSPIKMDNTKVQATSFRACLRPLALSHPVYISGMLTLTLSHKVCWFVKWTVYKLELSGWKGPQ